MILNLQNVINFFHTYDLVLYKSNKMYGDILYHFYNNKFSNPKLNDNTVISGCFCESNIHSVDYHNENYDLKFINVKKITICKLYPTLIYRLLKSNKMILNITEIKDIYCFIFENYKQIEDELKKLKFVSQIENKIDIGDPIKKLKFFITSIYVVISVSAYIWSTNEFNTDFVTRYCRRMMTHIFNISNIVYIDTDTIWVKGDTNEIIKIINKYGFDYKIEEIEFCFLQRKRYIEIDNSNNLKIRGFGGANKKVNSLEKKLIPVRRRLKLNDILCCQ